jgi:hypothetical protein
VGVTDPVTIFPSNTANPAVKLAVASGNASLTLIGVEAGKRLSATTEEAVLCSNSGAGTATLTMKKSAAQQAGTGKFGVSADECRVILDGNRIGYNVGGGVRLGGATQYTLTNNFIYRNMGTGVVIDASGPATGTFQFNTVVNNAKSGGSMAGGIDCGGEAPLIESSIFRGNTVNNTFGSCAFVNSDVDVTDPGFMNAASDDYRITTTSTMIVDRVTTTVDGGGMLVDHDFFGTRRPQGGGSDVGAHEKTP